MTHRCPLPARPAPGNTRTWRCPDCSSHYFWSKRMIGREMRECWVRSIDDVETRRIRNDREFDEFARRLAWIRVANQVLLAILVTAVAAWLAYRLA